MNESRAILRPVSVAPMMDRTDRHFRSFVRCITRHTLLYTQMIHALAVLRGDRDKVLGFDPREKPLALQLGGDKPADLAEAARIAEDRGFDEIQLNVGCPSSAVQQGRFGACLMREPERVAAAVEAMRGAVRLPVTVKHRLGVDEYDRYEDMLMFVKVVAGAGCDRFTVHARTALLDGLSPHENRTIPPLRYGHVYRLKEEHPELVIELNGGVTTLKEAGEHLGQVDAVMIGRAAYDRPYLLAAVDGTFFGDPEPPPTREEALARYREYALGQLAENVPAQRLVAHIHGLFAGRPHARAWRRRIDIGARERPSELWELLTPP